LKRVKNSKPYTPRWETRGSGNILTIYYVFERHKLHFVKLAPNRGGISAFGGKEKKENTNTSP